MKTFGDYFSALSKFEIYTKKKSSQKLQRVFEDDEFPSDALYILNPKFNYDDWKNKTVSELYRSLLGNK